MDLHTVKSWERKDHSLILQFEKGIAAVSFGAKDIIRFRSTDSSEWNVEEDLIVHAPDNNKLDFQLDIRENAIELSTGELRAELQLNPFAIAIFNKKGSKILSSSDHFLSIEGNRKVVRFTLAEQEGIYGLGGISQNRKELLQSRIRIYQQTAV